MDIYQIIWLKFLNSNPATLKDPPGCTLAKSRALLLLWGQRASPASQALSRRNMKMWACLPSALSELGTNTLLILAVDLEPVKAHCCTVHAFLRVARSPSKEEVQTADPQHGMLQDSKALGTNLEPFSGSVCAKSKAE